LSIGILLNVFAKYPVVTAVILLIGGGILLGIANLLTGITLFKTLSLVLIAFGILILLINFFLKITTKKQ